MFYYYLLLILTTIIKLNYGGGLTISSTDWSELSDTLNGRVVLPTDDDYDTLYVSWTATYDSIEPEAVVFCQSENDVVLVMNFILDHAAEDGSVMNFAVRSGKHNLAGWSCSDGLIIDVSGLNQLYVSDEHTAIVGPGVQLSSFTKFAEENNFTLPHGDCASVCFGGFLHGGGFGLISRTFGMGVDWIKSINIVLSTGELVKATNDDDDTYKDLFWALRGGGGGNFGIITQFEMNIPEKKQTNPGLYLEISWDYDVDLWSKISSTWKSFTEDSSYGNHFAVYLRITPVTYITKDYYIQLHGFWTGEQIDGLMVVAKLLDKISVTPSEAKIDYVPFEGWIESSATDRLRYASHCSSRFAFDRLDNSFFTTISTTLQEMIDYDNYADPTDEGELTYGIPTEFLFLAPAGGAISNHAKDETAFPWRDASYLFVVCARYMNDYDNAHNFVEEWIVSTMATVETYLSDKSFINFPDNNLANWQTAFYGDNYARLQTVKAKYDPDDIFKFAFSIEQPGTESSTNGASSSSSDSDSDIPSTITKINAKPKSKSSSYGSKKTGMNSNKQQQEQLLKENNDIGNEISHGKNETTYKFSLWNYMFVIIMIISATLICKTAIQRYQKNSSYHEYIPVNDQHISNYNTI